MPARVDLTGQKFGKLTVLEVSDKKQDGKRMWKCQCECGNITYSLTRDLRNGSRKSCGCLHKNTSKAVQQSVKNRKEKQKERWIGTKHGFLTVINIDETKKEKNGSPYWICKCENCGSIKSYGTSNLYTAKSCGCIKSKGELKITQLLVENNIPFEKQKTFPDCKSDKGAYYKYDFFIDNKYLIEYDGNIHFMSYEKGWANEQQLRNIQKRDNAKNEYAKNKNIPLIRIPYTKYETLNINDLLLETTDFLLNLEGSDDLSE